MAHVDVALVATQFVKQNLAVSKPVLQRVRAKCCVTLQQNDDVKNSHSVQELKKNI